jgi:RNA polymerase sigma-70 factor (ECF subfamily)
VQDFEAEALPHYDELFRTAARVVGDLTETEDIIQETYFQAWRAFERFQLGTNCRAWLFKILFNIIHRYRRKRMNERIAVRGDEMLSIEETLASLPPVLEKVSDEDVLAALAKIPPHYREVILLTDVEEFSYKEVSEALNIPMGTVMSRLSRARTLLRDELVSVARDYGIKSAGAKE